MDLRNIALLFHIVSLFVLAGGVIGSVIMETTLWKVVTTRPRSAVLLNKAFGRFPMFQTAGGLLMLVSGIFLLGSTHWYYWGQSWLTVKLVLYVFLAVHPNLTVKPSGKRLEKLLQIASATKNLELGPQVMEQELITEMKSIRNRFRIFNIIQISVIVTIFIITIYKPHFFKFEQCW